MAEGDRKSAYKNVLEALGRTQKRYEGAKERIEEIATEGVRLLVSGTVGFGAGLADQYFGEADKDTGIRVHKTNGAPSALIGAGLAEGAAAFGLFGKAAIAGYAVGNAGVAHSFSTWGRMAGERLRVAAEKAEKTKTTPAGDQAPAQVNGKTESRKLAKDAGAEVAAASGAK